MNNIKIANALSTLGSREKALELNRSGLDYYETAAKNPNLATAKREMAVTLFYRGTILLSNGDAAQALDAFRQSQAISRDMQKADPSNTVLLADLGGSTAGVGVALGANGQLREALATLERSLFVFAELRARDPLYQDLPALMGQYSIWKGDVLSRLGNVAEAQKSYQNALPNFEEVAKAAPTLKTRCDRGTAHAKLGHVLVALKDFDGARDNFQKALELTESLAEQSPVNPLALYVLTDAYSGLGDLEAAPAAQTKEASEKNAHWKSAVSWYEKSLEASRNIQSQSEYSPESFTTIRPADVRNRLNECQRYLAGPSVD